MTTTLISPVIVAREALISLENNMVMGGLVHRSFDKEYRSIGATVVVRKPTSFTATAFTTYAVASTITESSVAVILDRHWDVSFEVTSQELSLDVVDFSEQFIQPALRAIAQEVDKDILTRAGTVIAGHYAVSGTPVVSDIAGIEAVLDVLKAPLSNRRLVLHPVTKSAYLSLDAFLNADKRGDGGQALRSAEIGRVLGLDTYMDQNVQKITVNIMGGGTASLGTAWASGQTSGTVSMATAAAVSTALAGEVFKVTGYDQWFVLVVPCTAGTSGLATITSFLPATNTAIAAGSLVTFQDDHRNNLAFHKNAITLVTAPLEPPLGGARGAVASYNGLSCRVVYDYTPTTKKNWISVDFLCGVKVLDKDLAARLVDTR